MDLTPPPSSGAFVNVDEEYEDVEVGEFFDSINESIKRIPDYENLQDHQTKHAFIERLVKHLHKLSVGFALEMMLTLDLIEPLVTVAI